MKTRKPIFLCVIFLLLLPAFTVKSQQVADPNFDARVARPAYTRNNPRVLFDEAHNNFHTTTGRYKPFVDLITNDGYRVTPNRQRFQPQMIQDFDVLVIANALGAERMVDAAAGGSAFTDEECDVVRDWVRAGGSLLLIADHAPFGAAAENLARRFGVEMSKGYTSDSVHYERVSNNQSFLLFTRENRLLADHPITQGRNATERINRIMTFTGQSLRGPEGGVAFLRLSDTATDAAAPDIQAAIARARAGGGGATVNRPPGSAPLPPGATAVRLEPGERRSAAGRAQGIAFRFGEGRVVVLGEAAMLSAQLSNADRSQFGMNRAGLDNRQLALNIMHWLSGLLR